MMEAHGPVIVRRGRLLVTKDDKDGFYKIPGGRPREGEIGEKTCARRTKEETGLGIIVLERLTPMCLDRDPQTGEQKEINLYHYLAELLTEPSDLRSYLYGGREVRWLLLSEIKQGKYSVAPNIKFLIEKGDIA